MLESLLDDPRTRSKVESGVSAWNQRLTSESNQDIVAEVCSGSLQSRTLRALSLLDRLISTKTPSQC